MVAGAYLFADEHLGVVPLARVAILAFGLMSLAVSAGRLSRPDLPAIGVAMVTGLAIATYTIVDGLGGTRGSRFLFTIPIPTPG